MLEKFAEILPEALPEILLETSTEIICRDIPRELKDTNGEDEFVT